MFEQKDIVEYIMERSDAVILAGQLQDKLRDEQRRRKEFHVDMDDEKIEFVNGKILPHPPETKAHNGCVKSIFSLLDTFTSEGNLGYLGLEKIMTSFSRNDYCPDLCFFPLQQSKDFQGDQILFPIPFFISEVILNHSAFWVRHDRETKYKDYEKHGVSEYWLIDPAEETIEQYVLKKGKYELVLKSGEGHITSHAVKGFTIPIRAIFDKKTHRQALRDLLK